MVALGRREGLGQHFLQQLEVGLDVKGLKQASRVRRRDKGVRAEMAGNGRPKEGIQHVRLHMQPGRVISGA